MLAILLNTLALTVCYSYQEGPAFIFKHMQYKAEIDRQWPPLKSAKFSQHKGAEATALRPRRRFTTQRA